MRYVALLCVGAALVAGFILLSGGDPEDAPVPNPTPAANRTMTPPSAIESDATQRAAPPPTPTPRPAASVEPEPEPRATKAPRRRSHRKITATLTRSKARSGTARIVVDIRGVIPAELRDRLQIYLRRDRKKVRGLALRGRTATGTAEPGDYDLALADGKTYDHRVIALERVRLVTGENRLFIDAPVLHALDMSGPPEARVWYSPIEGHTFDYGEFGEDGLVHFPRVPAGRYLVEGYLTGSMVVRVPTRGTVAFRGRPKTAILVQRLDPQSWPTVAGLHIGDFVIGEAGRRFRDPGEILNAITLPGNTTFMVDRNGQRLNVLVNRKERARFGTVVPYPF